VSLLERFCQRHLTDAHFARLWTAGASHAHLDGCTACRARFEQFQQWVAGVGEELRAEADAAFPAERLAVQHAQIARRLETLERPGRVIAFPRAARAVISGNSHVRRWVTVAAAAGLLAGVGLDQVIPLRNSFDRERRIASSASHLTAPKATARAVEIKDAAGASQSDEELLSDAFARPRVSTLSALDDMTPHARDLIDRSR
jgi:anti-sigma factor RsiW